MQYAYISTNFRICTTCQAQVPVLFNLAATVLLCRIGACEAPSPFKITWPVILFLYYPLLACFIHIQSCGDMSQYTGPDTITKDPRAFIEDLARRKGTFTDAFKRKAKEEAENGRGDMLQAIEGSEENREDLSRALKM